MIDGSRRAFLKAIVPGAKVRQEPQQAEEILTLGSLAVFPVHSKTKIKLKNFELTVEVLPEGVRLRDEDANKAFRLSLNGSGLLQAHLGEEWPTTAVLSLFTGDIYNI